MHILFLSDNFPPETNAPASRLYEHAREWVRLGHRVTVITCAPNFPEGKVFPGYRNRWHAVEEMEGIRVVRVKTYITANEGFFRRIMDFVSFMIMGFIAGLFQKSPDVIAATSPQFFAAVGGWLLATVRRLPFVFELRDLWPAQIAAVGVIQAKSLLIRRLEKLELFLYRKADKIVTVTESFKRDLVVRGIPEKKITVVYNGVSLEKYKPVPLDEELAIELGVQNKFIVGYFGTHGLNQGLDQVLDAAQLLDSYKKILFLFAGAGVERKKLIEKASRMNLDNVQFLPPQPKEMMPRLWSLCNLALICLRNHPLYIKMIPSKLFEAMGMGVPVIMAMPEGEATAIVSKAGAGIIVPPEHPLALSTAIRQLADRPEQLISLGRGSHAAAQQFSRVHQAQKMLSVFQALIRHRNTELKHDV